MTVVDVQIVRTAPKSADAIGVPVATTGAVPRQVGLSRSVLASYGFEAKPGQILLVPSATGPAIVAVGIGAPSELSTTVLRTAAAAFARAGGKRASLATSLADVDGVDPKAAAQAVVEGVLLASYRYTARKSDPEATASKLESLALVVGDRRSSGAAAGAQRGQVIAAATSLARDLANTPAGHLTARQLADQAVAIAAGTGLTVEVFNRDQLEQMGCGGILGVNRGSVEPPRVVRLRYTPRHPSGHVALVGKGVMFDSGGLSLKPSDGMLWMKGDMSGAAAVLATMSTLRALRCKTAVTGYLMCTDNMPSGSAMKLGDVLTIRNGKTVEIHNTDAEGRLLLADGLSLAVEDAPDAIVDIATLTGACLVALGTRMAGVLGTDQPWIEQVKAAAERTDEAVWQLPLAKEYRKLLDSNVADMRNVGGPHAGAVTASLFLSEFTGDVPWAHIDMAGPMMTDADDAWLVKGATGYGARLLIDLVTNFSPG